MTAIRYTEEGFEEALKAQDIDLMVPLGFSLCTTYSALGQYKKIVDKMPEVINLIEKEGRESDFFATSHESLFLYLRLLWPCLRPI